MTTGRIPRLRAPALTIAILFAALALSFALLGSLALADDSTTVPPEAPAEETEATAPVSPTATASTSLSARQPSDAIDGSKATHWAAISFRYPQWLMIDLGARQRVVKSSISWLRSKKVRKYFYRLEGSLDGEEWTLLADRSKKSAFNHTNDTFDVEVQYLRVTVLGSKRGRAGIKEIKVKTDTTEGDEWAVVAPTPEPSPEPTEPGDEWAVVTPTPTSTPTATPTTPTISSLSASHTAIGASITITGTGFGSARDTSKVFFGEYRNPVGSRPCTRETSSYRAWSDTSITVTVPPMSPGVAGAPGTYHPVYVEVGGKPSNRVDFYIDPEITIDANTAAGSILPNSTRTVQTITYPSSPNKDGTRTFTTKVTYNSDTGPRPTKGNWVASGTHNVLFKDCTFIATNSQMNPNDTGVVTMGSFADPTGQHDIYNVTFYNCVFRNNTTAGSNGEGANGVKVYHNGPGRWGDWTFSECSFGTPNTTTGSFRRMGIELVEPVGGLSTYDTASPNYLQNIRVSDSDFETMGCMAFSFATYVRGPDRGVLIDDCTFKGNAGATVWGSSMIEFSGYGMEVRDSDFWAWKSVLFSLEGDARDIGGGYMAGTPCRRYFKNLTCDITREYATGMVTDGWSYIAIRDHEEYDVWDDCDFNFGTAAGRHVAAFNYGGLENTCFHSDMSTSYIHGYQGQVATQPTRAQDYWRTWTGDCADPATLYSDNDFRWPIFGARP